jgi:hypothetical protein
MNTAYRLGVLQRGFQSGVFDENLIENLDETHFTVNMDNGRTLGFRGVSVVKYADVVAGRNAMTMVIRISGGRRSMVEALMLIFTNGNNNYPIRGLEDTIPEVCYRTAQRAGWIRHYFLNILRNQELTNLISITVEKPFGWTIVQHTTLHLD